MSLGRHLNKLVRNIALGRVADTVPSQSGNPVTGCLLYSKSRTSINYLELIIIDERFAMPKGMNWDRINKENRIRRHGSAPGNDELPPTGSKADRRRQENALGLISSMEKSKKLTAQLKALINKTKTKNFCRDKHYQVMLLNEIKRVYKKLKQSAVNKYQEKILKIAEELIISSNSEIKVKLRKKSERQSIIIANN